MKQLKILLVGLACVTGLQAACASGMDRLASFIQTTKTARAEFTQVVTSPPRGDSGVARSKTSSGVFEFSRPHKFRFHYTKPFEQTIVADGQTLWLYDPDLNQVTARKQAQALGSTPAALIASATDLKALESDFALEAAPSSDALEWVVARPKAKDTTLASMRVGFRNGDLAVLEILDSLGQKSVLTFIRFQPNAALPASLFDFKPPAGTDVIRQ